MLYIFLFSYFIECCLYFILPDYQIKKKNIQEETTPVTFNLATLNLSHHHHQPQNAHALTSVEKHDWQSVILRALPSITVPNLPTLR